MRILAVVLTLLFCWMPQALADPAEILSVQAVSAGEGTWRFDVELRHPDEGWDHYADRWDVIGPDGKVIRSRILLHPHVEEQPFTRSLSGVPIAEEVTEVTLRARCSRDGYDGAESFTVTLPR